jgi:hypothetical protein
MVHITSGLVDQPGGRQHAEVTSVEQLPDCRNRVRITVAAIIGRRGPASRVVGPPGCLQCNPIRISEINRLHQAVVDHFGDLAGVVEEALAQRQQRRFVRQVERHMIELHCPLVWDSRGFGEAVHRVPPVFKERHGRPMAHIEKIVPERPGAYGGHEWSTEYPVPEPGGGIEIIGDQSKVVEPCPLD